MANPQAPPYPGFTPYVAAGSGPYPQQQYPYPGQQYLPGQQFSPPGQQYPTGKYPLPGQQYPTGKYPLPGQQYPQGQYPLLGQQYPQGQYSNGTGTNNSGFVPHGPPPIIHMPGPVNYETGERKLDDNTLSGWSGFTDKAIRTAFIRKVYFILMLQLLFSLAVVALFIFEPHTKMFVMQHAYLYYISCFIFLVVYIAVSCCGNSRRQYPTNIILFSIFTISLSYMLGTISSFYNTDVILLAVGICTGVSLAVSVFSFHSKLDFNSCSGVLFILVWVLLLFGITAIFTRHQILNTVYAGCGALLFVLFLACSTQVLIGGKKYNLSPEEHIFAAMQVYFVFFMSTCLCSYCWVHEKR